MRESDRMLKRVPVLGFDDVDLYDLPLVVVDFETSGLNASKDRIVEYGFALFDGGKCISQIGGFLNPGEPLSEEVQKIHGITDADLEHAPNFFEVLDLFEVVLANRIPVAYNAPFDRRFLLGELDRTEMLYTVLPVYLDKTEWIDPLVWVRRFHKSAKSKKLTDTCARLGVKLDNAHRATSDAKATGEVLMKLAPQIKEHRYAKLIEAQQSMGSAREWGYRQVPDKPLVKVPSSMSDEDVEPSHNLR